MPGALEITSLSSSSLVGGDSQVHTQRAATSETIDEESLSSERFQCSPAPVQRVGTTILSPTGDDSQVRTQRGKSHVLLNQMYIIMLLNYATNQCFLLVQDHPLIESLFKNY